MIFISNCSIEAQSVKLSSLLLASGIDPSRNHYNISLFSSSLHLPRYPSQSVCLDYSAKCASLIAVAQEPALFPDCNSSIPYSTVKKFPTFSQVLDTVEFPLTPVNIFLPSRSVNITLRSEPNNFTQAHDQGYRTTCPEGTFVQTYHLKHPNHFLFCTILCYALLCSTKIMFL